MARTFIIPMQPPANPSKIGTFADPWRPKYLRERGLSINNATSFRYWIIGEVSGTPGAEDMQLNALAAMPDVYEINPWTTIPHDKRPALVAWLAKRGITDANLDLQGDALVAELRRVCHVAQAKETAQERLAINADIAGA